jgi:O-antigen ligase
VVRLAWAPGSSADRMTTDRLSTGGRADRLPIERLLALGAWILIVVSVQPWVKPPRIPQASVEGGTDTGKGLLIGAVFMVAVALAAPGFRTRVPMFYLFYFLYLFIAAATAFHLTDPVPPLLRVTRLALGIAIPLLLWQWLGGRPEQFLRAHWAAHAVLALVILAGAAAAPGSAWQGGSFGAGGRLRGILLPMLPPRVGEIGAIVVGLTVVALTFGKLRRVPGTILVGVGLLLIALSRTRTAAAALLFALVVAFLVTHASRQGRRALLVLTLLIVAAAPFQASVQAWALRQQSAEQLSSFTGRTRAWTYVLEQRTSFRTDLLGHGLGNKRVLLRRGEGDVDVMGIDNGWLSLFWETGLLGVAVVLLAVIAAAVSACRAPTPYVRAAAVFLIAYVAVASFTETGLSDLSSQTLHLLVASGAAYADRLAAQGQRFVLPALATIRDPTPTRRH